MLEQRTLESFDGTRLCYYVAGDPDAPPLVISNGLGGNIFAFEPMIEHFARDFRIVSWDYRGLYRSGPGAGVADYGVPVHVRDMKRLLEHERVENPILMGWSMGVQVNLEYHRTHAGNVRGKVALFGTYGRPFRTAFNTDVLERVGPKVLNATQRHWRKTARLLARLGRYPTTTRAFVSAVSRLGVVHREVDRALFHAMTSEWTQLDLGIYAQIFEGLAEHDAAELLPAVESPSLVVAGGVDLFTPPEVSMEMARVLPDAELFVVPEATHFGPLEFPELISRRIQRFFEERLDHGQPAQVAA